jgi:hypothetical protein
MRKLLLLFAAALFAAPPAAAAEPTVELKIKAIKDLLPLAQYLGDLAGQGEQAEQGAKFVEAMAGKKGVIEGIDITKPIGFYATMTPNVIDSPMVVLVPVGDEKAFLNLLTGKLNLGPEKGDGDIYSVTVPNVPPKVYFKFHKGYVCVTVHNKATLDADTLLDPKDLFAKEQTSVLTLSVNLDRIPADVRKTVLGQMELKLADEKAKPAKTPAEEKAKALAIDATFAGVTSLFTDGKTASLSLNIDPKADDIGLDFSLTAKDGSDLKSLFASVAKRAAVAPLAAGKNAILSVAANLQIPESLMKKYSDVIDLAVGDALEKAKDNDRDAAKKFFDAVEPTLKAGTLQFGLSLSGSAGKHEVLAAVRTTSGKQIEALAKEFAPFIPEDKAKVKFDVEKVGAAALHEIVPPADEKVEKLFGKDKSVWLTTADDLFVVGFGGDATAAKKLARATPAPSPILAVELSVAWVTLLGDSKTKGEQSDALVRETFGDVKVRGNDTFKVLVTAGEKLSLNATIKGKALKLIAALGKKEKE